jgi:hypothetical protein
MISKIRSSSVLLILGVLLISMLSTSVSAYANTSAAANTSRQATNNSGSAAGLADPVLAGIYLNGSADSGIMSFNAQPGSESVIVDFAFPWANPSVSPNSTVVVTFAIYPFPAHGGAIPSWLQVATSVPSITVPYGKSSSMSLLIRVDPTAPETGAIGSFEVGCHYVDPVSGYSVTQLVVVRLNAGIPLTSANSTINHSIGVGQNHESSPGASQSQATGIWHGHGKDPSWALGVGLCNSSAKTQCGNTGISWSSVTAVSVGLSYPSLSPPSGSPVFFTVNAIIDPNMFLQAVLENPSNGTNNHNWELVLFYNDCSSNPCNYYAANIANEGSSGSNTMEIYYSSGWNVLFGANSYPFASWITQCCPSSTTYYGVAQEPFAFESYDSTQSVFSGMSNTQSPSFEYYSSGSWNNPSTGYVVNSNDSPSCSPAGSWPYTAVGECVATPSWFLEGGNTQCTGVSSPDVDIGDTGYVCTGATNTYATALF